jgi:hypothetical protein
LSFSFSTVLQRVFARLDKLSLEPLLTKLREFNATAPGDRRLSDDAIAAIARYFTNYNPEFVLSLL